MLLRCLLTRRNLFKRQVFGRIEEPHCVRCHGVLSETEDHLFITCTFAGAIWNMVITWIGLSQVLHGTFPRYWSCLLDVAKAVDQERLVVDLAHYALVHFKG